MEIKYGAEVLDKTGKVLGTIDYIVRDTYTGDIREFKVNSDLVEADLFYSPEDILESAAGYVKLKSAFDKPDKNSR